MKGEVQSVGLIDFNTINGDLEPKYGPLIHYIIDHHVDSNLYLDSVKDKNVKLVGSAQSLLVNKIWTSNILDGIPQDQVAGLALLLSAAV